MEITLSSPTLYGRVAAIPSKSHVHRLLICSALADTPTEIRCPLTNNDIDATVRCLTALGAQIQRNGGVFQVTPIPRDAKTGAYRAQCNTLDCGESGSTLRFLLPLLSALGCGGALLGHGRLPARPLSPLYEELTAHGVSLSPAGTNPLTVSGHLTSGTYVLNGSVSSQFITGLLYALPLLPGESTLEITGKLESAPYVQLTLEALETFGIHWKQENDTLYRISPSVYTSPGAVTAEGDWSNSAFWLTAGALSETGLIVTGLHRNSVQGDAAILSILQKMGAKITWMGKDVHIMAAGLQGCEIDGSQIPDLVPILSVAAAAAVGETYIYNIGRLRLKESDRITSIAAMLTSLGAQVTTGSDWLRIQGSGWGHTPEGGLVGGTVNSCNDHRITMSAAIASMICHSPVTILGAEAADKSYPTFFKDFRLLHRQDYICSMCAKSF